MREITNPVCMTLQAVPHSTISSLMRVFSQLPQRVIIKLDSEHWRHAAPSNVLVLSWLPQQAVLAHNNTRLFITHCGMHGVLESVHYGVPMVGMPVFIDQAGLYILQDLSKGMSNSGLWKKCELFLEEYTAKL